MGQTERPLFDFWPRKERDTPYQQNMLILYLFRDKCLYNESSLISNIPFLQKEVAQILAATCGVNHAQRPR
jgi:hypothetical protein